MTDNINETKNDVRSTSVAITLNAKNLGVDAFIKLEQTVEFTELASEVDALVKREEIAALLTEQALSIAKDTAGKVKSYLLENGVAPIAPARTTPVGTGASAITAVANGATPNGDWRTAIDAFDSAKQVRFLSTQSFSKDQLTNAALSWLVGQGFNSDCFDIWDERRDAESGKPISSVCNIKVKEGFRDRLPAKFIFTDRGGIKAIARAKFNSDGSLYFHWANKELSTAIEYGAFDGIKG